MEEPIAIIYNRYKIHKDGTICDTHEAKGIPEEVLDIRDLLMKKIHIDSGITTVYYLIKCEEHNMFNFPQVVGKSYNKDELLNMLKEPYKKHNAKFTINEYSNGNLIKITVDIYNYQETYWITSDFEINIKKVSNET